MKKTHLSLRKAGSFSEMFLDYIEGQDALKEFYEWEPKIESFKSAITNKAFSSTKRKTLVDALEIQYDGLNCASKLSENIQSLSEARTFTVTTGHQLNIFTGPLYFLFKLITTINLSKKLQAHYPDYHFIPVYWMATEDHDFAEISCFNMFGKKYQWATEQTGAVGRFDPSSLAEVLDQIHENVELFEKAYGRFETLADSVRFYVNELFGSEGLIVVDGDDRQLKAQFAPIMKDDILNQNAHQRVKDTNEQLIDLGYKSQAFSRPINFFYLDDFRRRIISDGENFSVLDSDIKFTKQEILSEIDHYPERFSPNVIMRPIYQEVILPNIAYLGGPAEIIYWLQLKGVFDYYKMSFPVLMPRNFGMIINQTTAKKAKKLGIADEQLFRSKQQLKTDYLSRTSTHQPSLNDQKQSFSELFETIKIKAELIDQSLGGYIGSEQVKAIKALEHIEKKFKKSLEKNHQTALTQIEGIKDRLFPNGVLQERSENYLNFYFNNTALIQELLDEFEPFKFSFYLFWEE